MPMTADYKPMPKGIKTEMLAKAAEWMKNNKLTLHLGKTKAQLIGSYRCVTKKHYNYSKIQ